MVRVDTNTIVGGEAALLEREAFTEALGASFGRVASGAGRLVLLSGEAGIGKSVLVRRFCDARAGDARLLWGACDALQTPRPLSPLIDIAAVAQGPLRDAVRQGEKPHAVFLALCEELRGARPAIVVIEDVHWADEATLDVVRLLARRAESLGGLVVVTYRDDELDAAHPLRLAVGELGTAPGVVRLHLPPLSRDAVAELAGPHGVDVEELYARTAGNPFFVTEVLAGSGTGVPPTVRDAVLARMSRLGPGARTALEAVAVIPAHAEIWLLGEVVPDEVQHVDACLATGMLRGEGRSVWFRHELARLAVEQSLGPHRRTQLHRLVLDALRDPSEGSPDPAQLAHHADAAGDAEAALTYAREAGSRAADQGAHREAAAQYERALRYADGLPAADLAQLLELRALECYLTAQPDESVGALERALECHRRLGDRRAEAAALCELAATLWCPGRIEDAKRVGLAAVEALAGLEPSRELALAYITLAEIVEWEDGQLSLTWAKGAGELAERLGEAEIALHARMMADIDAYMSGLGADPAGLEHTQQLAEQEGFERVAAAAILALALAAVRQWAHADADRYIEAALSYCEEHDLEIWLRYVHALWARAELDRCHWDEAGTAASFALYDPGPSVVPRLWSLAVIGLVRARRGDPDAAEPLAQATVLARRQGQLYALAPVAAAQAELAWLEGRLDDIAEITEEALGQARRQRAWREIGELARWRWRAGVRERAFGAAGPDRATLAGDWQEAARLWNELGCPYEAALALADADDDDALLRALSELRRLGARPASAIVARRLRERGARHVPRGPNAKARQNPAGLTARELEVLDLLCDGLRNSEIAARLVVSPRTVDHQVSAVLRKLGVRTRRAAAELALRDGLATRDRQRRGD